MLYCMFISSFIEFLYFSFALIEQDSMNKNEEDKRKEAHQREKILHSKRCLLIRRPYLAAERYSEISSQKNETASLITLRFSVFGGRRVGAVPFNITSFKSCEVLLCINTTASHDGTLFVFNNP